MGGFSLYPEAKNSDGSQTLQQLVQTWEHAQQQKDSVGSAWASKQVEPLAKQLVAHRDELFAKNAVLLAEASEGEASSDAKIAANQAAIKLCTTLLGEMTFALGRTSIKP